MREPKIFRGWPRSFPAEYSPQHGHPAVHDDAHDGDTFACWVRFAPEVHAYRAIRIANLDAIELNKPGGREALGALLRVLEGSGGRLKVRMLYKSFDRWASFVTLDTGEDLRGLLLKNHPELFAPWTAKRAQDHTRAAGLEGAELGRVRSLLFGQVLPVGEDW